MTTPLIDLHLHLLPGLDDGPASDAGALELAQLAVSRGTRIAVCTPHLLLDRYPNLRSRVLAATERFRRVLAEAQVPLEILPGAEVMLHPQLIALYDRGELPTLADRGRHVLLELPWSMLPPGFDSFVFQLAQRGLQPIIAHPERYAFIQRRPALVGGWVERGLLIQVNAAHLAGGGWRASARGAVRRTARRLLEAGWVHFLASDGHSPERPPDLGPHLDELGERYGAALAERARANAALVLEGTGRGIAPLPAARPRRRFWAWWR